MGEGAGLWTRGGRPGVVVVRRRGGGGGLKWGVKRTRLPPLVELRALGYSRGAADGGPAPRAASGPRDECASFASNLWGPPVLVTRFRARLRPRRRQDPKTKLRYFSSTEYLQARALRRRWRRGGGGGGALFTAWADARREACCEHAPICSPCFAIEGMHGARLG